MYIYVGDGDSANATFPFCDDDSGYDASSSRPTYEDAAGKTGSDDSASFFPMEVSLASYQDSQQRPSTAGHRASRLHRPVVRRVIAPAHGLQEVGSNASSLDPCCWSSRGATGWPTSGPATPNGSRKPVLSIEVPSSPSRSPVTSRMSEGHCHVSPLTSEDAKHNHIEQCRAASKRDTVTGCFSSRSRGTGNLEAVQPVSSITTPTALPDTSCGTDPGSVASSFFSSSEASDEEWHAEFAKPTNFLRPGDRLACTPASTPPSSPRATISAAQYRRRCREAIFVAAAAAAAEAEAKRPGYSKPRLQKQRSTHLSVASGDHGHQVHSTVRGLTPLGAPRWIGGVLAATVAVPPTNMFPQRGILSSR